MKYYDLISYDVVEAILSEMGVPCILAQHMLASWRDAQCTLQTAYGPTSTFQRKSGIPKVGLKNFYPAARRYDGIMRGNNTGVGDT